MPCAACLLCPVRARSGLADVTVFLRDATKGKAVSLALCWDIAATAPPCGPGKAFAHKDGVVAITDLAVPKWQAWSPSKPNLHTLTVFLVGAAGGAADVAADVVADAVQVRFGMRTVATKGRSVRSPSRRHAYCASDPKKWGDI